MSQSNSPPPSQPDQPTPPDPQAFIEYSRALHEWTRRKWLQAVIQSEERRALLEQEYHASRNLRSQPQLQAQQQVQQTSTMPQQPVQTSAGAEAIDSTSQTTQSPSNHNKAS